VSNIRYRADIDGLRSIAVLPVMLFHFGLAGVPGGFVGVDVFFVISGYLIATIISRELQEGRFSLLRFYERRIRRIFPALFVMMGIVLLVAALLFVPADLNATGQSAFAATFFASNVLFYLETGYFDAYAYDKPLLHTWSLAIEEQFYLFVPLILMAVAWRGKNVWRRMGLWVTALTLLSFLLSAFATAKFPTAAYYLIPWRTWELGIGAMLALNVVPRMTTDLQRHIAGVAGLTLILCAAVTIDKSMTFPGVIALAPVLGAALIIQAGRDGTNFVGRVLSHPMPVLIGKLSYSLYLWHWPLVVFYVYWTFELPDTAGVVGLFAASFLAAWLSWRFVEQPFRHGKAGASRWPVFLGGGAAMGAVALVGGLLAVLDGLPNRLSPEAVAITRLDTNRYGPFRECFADKMADESWLEPCVFGDVAETDAPVRVALWSDSHGPSYLPGLEIAAQKWGERIALYGHDGCPGVMGLEVFWIGNDHACADFIEETFDAILNDPDIELVVYAMRAPIYAQGWVDYGFAEKDRNPILIGSRAGPLHHTADRMAYFLTKLEQTVQRLEDAGKTVALIYPIPEAGMSVPAKLVRTYVRGQEPGDVTLSRDLFDARSEDLIAAFDELLTRTNIIPIRSFETFCDADDCALTRDGLPIFTDSNHLAPPTARSLAPLFDPMFEQHAES